MVGNDLYSKLILELSRLALVGKPRDVQLYIKRVTKKVREDFPGLANDLMNLLKENPSQSSPVRSATMASVPVDSDSRLQLMKFEHPVSVEVEPIWSGEVGSALDQIINERKMEAELFDAGLSPTRSLLFSGEPGVGKTLAAKWLAHKLNLPLLVLDLSAVMSSFLGRTGTNVRNVFDYARGVKCILFLDELDAIAKRRDDIAEIGELKRLVTVLLQEIDDWPTNSILIAATNHPGLLDPAVWRRFDIVLNFPMPSKNDTFRAIGSFIGECSDNIKWQKVLSILLHGMSYSDIERDVIRFRRQSIIQNLPFDSVIKDLISDKVKLLPNSERQVIATELVTAGLSQRLAKEWTGTSRDTIRKALKQKEKSDVKND